MMIIPIVQYAAAAVTATLAVSSGRNILQTWRVVASNAAADSVAARDPASSFSPAIDERLLKRLKGGIGGSKMFLNGVQSLNRKEFLELHSFSSLCRAPTTLDEVQGEWDGILLNNNGPIMTSVTSFLTNRLFGRGRKWNGKAFFEDLTGMNRFHSRKLDGTELEHGFRYNIRPSRLSQQASVISLDYVQSQSIFSLWKTMKDELRVLDIPSPSSEDDEEFQILLGLGCMAWSGGMLNASPFVLYRSRPTTKAT